MKVKGIRQQVSIIAMTVTGVVVALILIVQLAATLQRDLRHITDQSETLAQIVGDNASAAMAFYDPAAAEDTLATLARSPLVLMGRIHNVDGSLFTEYRRDQQDDISLASVDNPAAVLAGHMYVSKVVEPLVIGSTTVGSITLWINTWDAYLKIFTSIWLSLIIWVLGIVIAYLLAERLNRRAVAPLHDLSEVMITVSTTEDYSQRFEHKEDNEIGTLADSFNQMLARIDDREARLRDAISDLEIARDQAEQAARTKSAFLANMSHEIRTPMHGVVGMTALLKRTQLDDQQQHYFNTIEKSAQSLLMIIDDILDFTKIEAGKLEIKNSEYSVRDASAAIAEFFAEPARRKNLEFIIDIDDGVPATLIGDSGRVRQVLINLIGNAIKFTDQGKVALKISVIGDDYHETIRFSVTDTGIGLSKDEAPSIFEEFFQADSTSTRQFGGTGLGLAISKQLVTLMAGRIAFESTPGVGSTFWFDLPLHRTLINPFMSSMRVNSRDTVSNPFSTALGNSTENGADSDDVINNAMQQEGGVGASYVASEEPLRWDAKVLVAEDSEVNQFIIKELLAIYGITPVIVENGQQAVDRFLSECFELVFMDIQMPVMDGVEATSKLREAQKQQGINAECSIVGLSAHAMAGDRERYLEQGMDDYITKPIDIDELGVLLKRLLKPQSSLILWR